LPRTGQSSVYNTFLKSFYYDAATPAGVIASPASGSLITGGQTTIIVRADSNALSASINIADGNTNNDDAITGDSFGNGTRNGAPVFVTHSPVSVPTPSLTAQYPNLPVEFHFQYPAVPSSGTATVTVLLNEITTQVLTNRFTTLTQTFFTAAPPEQLQISNPSADGQPLLLASNAAFTIQACFTANLDSLDPSPFTVSVNGLPEPRTGPGNTPLYSISGLGCGGGLSQLNYSWTGATPGTNVINVSYQGSQVLTAQRTVVVFDPNSASSVYGRAGYSNYVAGVNANNPATWLKITGAANGLIRWQSVPGRTYQVLASTNLAQTFLPVSTAITATSSNTVFFDSGYTNNASKFYLIQVFPIQ
jgi:hypothetical protein